MITLLKVTEKATEAAQKYTSLDPEMTLHEFIVFLKDQVMVFIPNLISAIIILWVGLKLIKLIERSFKKMLLKKSDDPSLITFSISAIDIALKILLVVIVITKLGVETTSIVAVVGAAGLAIGLALQGTLQNFAGGFIILMFKPFRTGDDIEFGGHRGVVKVIQIFNTVIESPITNKVIIVPNSQIASNTLINYSRERLRRIDTIFSIAYGESVDKAREIIMDEIKKEPRIVTDPVPDVVLQSLAQSSVDLMVRAWVYPLDYFDVTFKFNETVYNRFNEAGIEIPFPQVQIHQKKD